MDNMFEKTLQGIVPVFCENTFSLSEKSNRYKSYLNLLKYNYDRLKRIKVTANNGEFKFLMTDVWVGGFFMHHVFDHDIFEILEENSEYFQFCISNQNDERLSNAIDILGIQYSHLKNLVSTSAKLSEKNLFSMFDKDLDFCRQVYNYGVSNNNVDLKDKITKIYRSIIRSIAISFSFYQKILQCYQFLSKQIEEISVPELDKYLIYEYICINKNYLIDDPDDNNYLLEEYKSYFEEYEKIFLSQPLFDSFKEYRVELNTIPRKETSGTCDKIIIFFIPFRCIASSEIIISSSLALHISPAPNEPEKDPITFSLNEFDMPISPIFISDLCDVENASFIRMRMKNISCSEDKSNNDAQEAAREYEALHNTPYYPEKNYIIKVLRENFDKIKNFIDIKLPEININLFSNYQYHYFHGSLDNTLYWGVKLLTSSNSFSKARERYMKHLSLLQSSHDIIAQILSKNLFLSTGKDLKDLVYFVCEKTLIEAIENNGCSHFLYDHGKKKPLSEPLLQPFVYSQLKPLLNYMGITISREPLLANGALDFLCSGTNNSGDRISLAIELKKAQHDRLIHGIQSQLPKYMEAERTKYGIFLVLWFKSETYNFPTRFASISELKAELEKNKPKKGKSIDICVINCVKQSAPSK